MLLERVRASRVGLGAVAVLILGVASVSGLTVAQARLETAFPAVSHASSSTTASTAPTAAAPEGAAGDLLIALNSARTTDFVPALSPDPALARVAQRWAEQMAANGTLDHQDLDAVLDLGFDSAGETILAGPPETDAAATMRAWLSSPANRSTVLSRDFNTAGVGIAIGADGRVWIAVDLAG